mgnify:CR=1 FL=1
MNRMQRNQVRAWLKLRDVEKITVHDFIDAQPNWIPWLWIVITVGWLVAELLGYSSLLLRLFAFAGIYFTVMLYFRTRAYWPLQRQALDWSKVEEMAKEIDR